MGKKDKSKERKDYTGDKNIQIVNIGDLCTERMQIFGANTNLMRQIPALADGLKPGERRIMWALFNDLKSKPTRNTIKVARITGEVIGKYHPHGDGPVFHTLVRLGQHWNNLQVLIDGQGNFGSPMGQTASAARYIEARISKYAYKCFFEDFNPNIVNMKPNFLGDSFEPEYLPARYPNVLINHTFGIGYGLSTGLPTYNLQEVLELTIAMLDDPTYKKTTLIPDSPTGAHVIDEGRFEEISLTGKGKFKTRGQIDIDYENNELIIRTVPLQVTSNAVKEEIINLHDENKIQGIIGVDDDSSEGGIKLHIRLKKEIDPLSVMYTIYTKTKMEKTDPVNFKLVDDYQDFDYNIPNLILDWIEFRRETKRIEYNYLLIESRERQHVLETVLHILAGDNAEKTLKVIRKAESREEIIEYLMKSFKISSLQAKNIADMRLSVFSKKGIQSLKDEKKDIDGKVKKFDKIIRSNKKIDKIIREELEEGIELFGEPRRSKVISIDGEVKVSDTQHVMVFTTNGFIKKLPHDSTTIGFINPGDYPMEIIHCHNQDELLLFDETGKISKITVSDIQNSIYSSEGEKLSKFASVNGKISSIIPKPKAETLEKLKVPVYFLMSTKNGLIKKTEASHYVNIKNELLGMIIKDGDELQHVKLLAGDKDILVYTSKGLGVRFPSTEIRETGRMSIGVKALDLASDEMLIGMDIMSKKDKFIFCLTNKGTGKKSTLDNFKSMDRASKPLRIITLATDEEVILIRAVKGTEEFKTYLKNTVEDINIEDVIELPRLSKGKKLIGVRKGEVIIDIREVKK